MRNTCATLAKIFSVFTSRLSLPKCSKHISGGSTKRRKGRTSASERLETEKLSLPPRHNEDNKEINTASTTCPFFAVTIGIDNYLRAGTVVDNLSGCVADADDILDFLIETLHVPPANITSLRNEDATAAGIISALESLAADTRIPKDANIFIFYAGHGSEALPPVDWPSNDMIQVLLPYDFDIDSGLSPVATNELADIKLAQLLENIADMKGNKITVVFDCCHSGSGTRHYGRTDERVRFAARGVDLPKGTRLRADTLPASRGSKVLDKDKNKGLASHVLLAACTELQLAQESNGRGAFTFALMNLLRSEDLSQLTYLDIIQRLPALPSQNPQCEGINQGLIFFSNYDAGPRRVMYNLTQPESSTNIYIIDAGDAHGVAVDAEFDVYDTKRCTCQLGRLVVCRTSPFQSTLRQFEGDMPFIVPDTGAFATQNGNGSTQDVRLFVDDSAGAFTYIQEMVENSVCHPPLKLVARREDNPELVVTENGGTDYFEITDKICRDAGLFQIPSHPATSRETMESVLRGVAHFYWNLRRTTTGKQVISPRIGFECHELEIGEFGAFDAMKPIGDNLSVDGVIQVGIGDEEKPYGFRINNGSTVSLFVSMFYFNMSDLSITSYYQPPSAGHKDHFAPLPPGGYLTIGYGTGGSLPHTFYLNEGEDVDVGYLKLFFSTEHVDYSHVPQESPFLPQGRVYHGRKPKCRLWDTLLIPIIQRRESASQTDRVDDHNQRYL